MMELTKERLTQIVRAIDGEAYDEAEIMGWFNSDDIMAMARQLLASMEQEPVGEVVLGDYDDCGDYPDAKVVCTAAQGQADWNNFRNGTKLYAAPQLPQPAPEHLAALATLESKGYTWHGGQLWKPPIGKAPLYITGEESTVPETLPCPVMLEPGLRFGKGVRTQTMLDALQRRAEYYAELEAMTPERRADHDVGMKEFAAVLQGAKSGERLGAEFEESLTDLIDAEMEPTCWCLTCRPVTMNDARFVVCPDCGNKRCPHANDHRNTCTGSNEPGQEGSAYPAAPQQE